MLEKVLLGGVAVAALFGAEVAPWWVFLHEKEMNTPAALIQGHRGEKRVARMVYAVGAMAVLTGLCIGAAFLWWWRTLIQAKAILARCHRDTRLDGASW